MTPPTLSPAIANPSSLLATQGKDLLDPNAARGGDGSPLDAAEQTRDAFTKFVGATVFGQMLSSMRKTVGEPAYFHGGQAEKVFQGQLDQAIADEMVGSGGASFANTLFEQQFPEMAEILHSAEQSGAATQAQPLDQLANLRRL